MLSKAAVSLKLFVFFIAAVVVVIYFLQTPKAMAEIHRWQDANGQWHFSDTPVDKHGNPIYEEEVEEVDQPATTEDAEVSKNNKKDLSATLNKRYKPTSDIERVTLSVVAIETHMGSGSGFFITDTGYLITNKHVIRPTDTRSSEKLEKKMKKRVQQLEEVKRELKKEADLLKKQEQRLADYKRRIINRSRGEERGVAEVEYEAYLARYEKRLKRFEQVQQKFEKDKKKHDKAVADYEWKSALSKTARHFDVFLKNNKKYRADLVKLSAELDLALLKLNDYKTPFLTLGKSVATSQGLSVYAVGSPLGMRDSMTSGIITRIDSKYLVTDAQILPGNSGGPLVDVEGRVLGVNTLKFGKTANSEGFGFAIPIKKVLKEFESHLPSSALTLD